jgi:hypothetical protein
MAITKRESLHPKADKKILCEVDPKNRTGRRVTVF